MQIVRTKDTRFAPSEWMDGIALRGRKVHGPQMKTVPYAVSVLRRSTLTGRRVIWKMLAMKTLILTRNTERLYRAHQYGTVRGKRLSCAPTIIPVILRLNTLDAFVRIV